jgi:hypothetical protein
MKGIPSIGAIRSFQKHITRKCKELERIGKEETRRQLSEPSNTDEIILANLMALEETQDVIDQCVDLAPPLVKAKMRDEISGRMSAVYKRIIEDERRNLKPVKLPTDAAQP